MVNHYPADSPASRALDRSSFVANKIEHLPADALSLVESK
jgi:hypothetical protein